MRNLKRRIVAGIFLVNACIFIEPEKPWAQSLPQGGQVVGGQAIISQPGSGQLLINQSSRNAIINWQSFSIGAGNQTHFNNGSGATLNRVTGASRSDIFGTLSASGSLYLINPNGIVIGDSGVVRTGGNFVASTLDVSDSQFMGGGDLLFSGQSEAEVVNFGTIAALDGDVALLGLNVSNEGTIDAPNGTVGLISGREILMRQTGTDDGKFFISVGSSDSSATNKGTIQAASAELRANGGNVYALAGNRGGAINATGVTRRGGRIFLTAPGGRVVTSSRIRATRSHTRSSDHSTATGHDGGEITIEAEFVALGSPLSADGDNGGLISVRAQILSLAEPINARGYAGNGGRVNIEVGGDTLATSTSIIDVSGTQAGGSIRHVTGQTLTTSGSYIASSQTGLGGSIDVTGAGMRLLSASFAASGYSGGGTIRLGGEYQGGRGLLIDELPNAQRLAMTDATIITADATGLNGDGGTIITWADERAAVLGQFSATPGTETGEGGFVEISSSGELIYRAEVETSRGERKGTVLIDPTNITIADVTFDQSIFILGSGYSSPNLSGSLDDGDNFGRFLSLDGNRIAIGALFDDGLGNSANNTGAVYLFTFTDTNFSGGVLAGIIGEGYSGGNNIDLSAALDNGDEFGRAVSLDGTRLVVGAIGDDGAGNASSEAGAVYLFNFSDAAFSNGVLTATIGHGYAGPKDIDLTGLLDSADNFAQFASLDGNRLAVGAPADDGQGAGGAANFGAVYLFSFTDPSFSGGQLEAVLGSGYNTRPKDLDLSAQLAGGPLLGNGVSLDGTRLAAGAGFHDSGGTNKGAVFLLTFTDLLFSGAAHVATIGSGFNGPKDINISANLDPNDLFGGDVSLDGNRLVVGSPGDDGFGLSGTGNFTGAVYLFSFTDAAFAGGTLEAIIGAGYTGGKNVDISANLDGNDNFAASISLDGNRLAVGAFQDDGQGNTTTDTGAAYLFTFTDDQFNGGQLVGIIGSGYNGLTGGKNIDLSVNLDDNDQLGASISLDGNRLAIGVIGDDGAGNSATDAGAVYLFTFADENFSGGQLAGIVGKGYVGGNNVDLSVLDAGDQFGFGVSLDGSRLAAGALGDDGAGNSASNTGAVHLITFSDASFANGTLSATVGQGYTGPRDINVVGFLDGQDEFGQKVSLSGNLLAISAPADDGFGSAIGFINTGAVYLFSFADQSFNGGQLRAVIGEGFTGGNNLDLSANLDGGDTFGLGLSLDGQRLAVGASGDDSGGSNTGAVYLFTFNDQTFSGLTLQATIGANFAGPKDIDLAANLDINDQLGTSVSLQGNRLVAGAQLDDGQNNSADYTGAAYLFTFTDQSFSGGSLVGVIGKGYTGGKNVNVPGLESGDSSRQSVSLDGNRLVIGTPGDDGLGNTSSNTGAAYLFTFTDNQFSGGQLVGIIGSGYTDAGNIDLSGNLENSDQFGRGVSLDGTRLAVGAPGDDGFGNVSGNSGAVYLFSFADLAFSGGTLVAIMGEGYTGGKNLDLTANLDAGDGFGYAVSLDGNRLAVGALQDQGAGNAFSNSGAAYLFTFSDSNYSNGSLQGVIGRGYSGGKNLDVGGFLGNGDQFGQYLSLDGNRLAVGAPIDDGFGDIGGNTGAVYLFKFADAAFSGGSLEAIIGEGYTGGKNIDISANLDNADTFGNGVSLDGNRLAAAAPLDDNGGNNTGAVYLFTFDDLSFTNGTVQAVIGANFTGGNNIDIAAHLDANDVFGADLSLDGTHLVVGAPGDDARGQSGAALTGAAYLFTFTDTSFSGGSLVGIIGSGYDPAVTGRVKDVDIAGQIEVNDIFAAHVSLDNGRLAIGAFQDDGLGNTTTDTGAVYLFTDPFGLGAAAPVSDAVFGNRIGQSITITPASITALLNAGNNVILQASNDLTVVDPIITNNPGGNGGNLTFQTGRSIFINANVTTDNGDFTLIGNDTLANGVINGDRSVGSADIVIAAGVTINLGSGRFIGELRDGAGIANANGGAIRIGGAINAGQLEFNNLSGNGLREIVLGAGASLTASGTGEALVFSGGRFTNNAGAGALSFTGAGRSITYSSDYDLDNLGGLTGTFLYNRTITSAPPNTITQTGAIFVYSRQPILTITASNATREYGASDPAFGFTVAGLVNGDTQAGAISAGSPGFSTTTSVLTNVGTFAGDIQSGTGSLASDVGYGFTFAPGTLTITQAPLTITANDQTREFGLGNPALTTTINGFRNGDTTAAFTSPLLVTTAANASSVAGNFAILPSGAVAGNYNISFVNGTLTVTPGSASGFVGGFNLPISVARQTGSQPVETNSGDSSVTITPPIFGNGGAPDSGQSNGQDGAQQSPRETVSIDFGDTGQEVQFEISGDAQTCFANSGANSACQFLPTIILGEVVP